MKEEMEKDVDKREMGKEVVGFSETRGVVLGRHGI